MSGFDPIQSLIEDIAISDHNNAVAANTVLRYYAEMNDVEKRFLTDHSEAGDEPSLSAIIEAKTAVHERFWKPTDDEYWKPCSHSNRQEYNVDDIRHAQVFSDARTSFLVKLSFRSASGRQDLRDIIYQLEAEDWPRDRRLVIVNCYT